MAGDALALMTNWRYGMTLMTNELTGPEVFQL